MDINDVRIVTTLLSLVLFVGIVAWTWSRRRHAGFEEAARLPFAEGEGRIEHAGEKQ